jgi:DNA (cytosine-5)-methyltransferase 1
MVKGKKVKMFHGQWYSHGSKTILQETAHSRSLFLMNKCEDNPTASIYKKCKVRMLGLEEKETLDDGKTDASEFHCR